MPFDERIVNQVREMIADRTDNVEEKVMFGGLCFMVNDKICIGVKKTPCLYALPLTCLKPKKTKTDANP